MREGSEKSARSMQEWVNEEVSQIDSDSQRNQEWKKKQSQVASRIPCRTCILCIIHGKDQARETAQWLKEMTALPEDFIRCSQNP